MINPHTVFCRGCTNLQPHQQCTGVPLSPCFQQLLLACLFDASHSNRHEVTYRYGFDLHFPWWLALLSTLSYTCWQFKYPWKNLYLGPFVILYWVSIYLSIYLSIFGYWVLWVLLNINPSSVTWFANTFSDSVGCLFTLLILCVWYGILIAVSTVPLLFTLFTIALMPFHWPCSPKVLWAKENVNRQIIELEIQILGPFRIVLKIKISV